MTHAEMESDIQELDLTAPRVTLDHVQQMLRERVTYRYEQPTGTTLTLCHAFLDGVFYLATGKTSCVSLDNFNVEFGRQYAHLAAEQLARDKLYELEGYCLYRKLNPEQF